MSARPLPIPINPALLRHADQRRQSLENRIADTITRFAGSMLFVSVDWLCLPRFDSAACFAALLGRRGTVAGSSRPLARSPGGISTGAMGPPKVRP